MEEETKKRSQRVPRGAKKTAVSVVVLLVLLVAAGVAYTAFLGPGSSKTPAKSTVPQTPAPVAIKPTAPSANTQESAAIEFLSSPVPPGGNASVNVKTVATSKCTISITYGSVAGTDAALGPKTADDFGNVTWDWTVPANAPTGTWPVKVTCARQDKSAFVQGDLQVTR